MEGAESRARSLGARSRSRGRQASKPNELLARRQAQVGENQSLAWSSMNLEPEPEEQDLGDQEGGKFVSGEHKRRSQIRRAKLVERRQQQQASGEAELGGGNRESVEAKLESLSEMLKNHQQQQQQMFPGDEQADSKSIESVYILLAKKEKDLQLAAELGKVLLEKNDELSKANERITEDYSHKLELLEQDKHKLRRKLDSLDGEYENRLIELQTDCNILKKQLEEQQQLAKQMEKEKSKLIDDLVQQNQRLTNELVEATKSEELLSSQLEQMNQSLNVRLSNRQDHVTQLESLKEEIQIVNQRKQDLERRLKLANLDKTNLNLALEESSDKLLLIESLLNEKDLKFQELLEEINELRDSSSWLSNELEAMINLNEKLAESEQNNSLAGDQASDSPHLRKRSQLIEKLKELRLRKQSRLKASEFIELNRVRNNPNSNVGQFQSANRRPPMKAAARRGLAKLGQRRNYSLFAELDESSSSSNSNSNDCLESGANSPDQRERDDPEANGDNSDGMDRQLSEKLLIEIYSILRRFQVTLQMRKDNFNSNPTLTTHLYSPNSTDDSGISSDDAASDDQYADPAAWRRLLENLKHLIEEMPCSSCHLMIYERSEFELLQKTHSKLLDELRVKNDDLLKLNTFKMEQEIQMKILNEKCELLQNDLSNCDKNQPKEEIVKLAWKARDEAVERKNAAEISLAKTRIENMQISSQLMEVVQQKGELSQKLAQFEDDIHYITQHSVRAKFTWEEYAENVRRSKANRSLNPLAQLLNFSSSVIVASSGKLQAASESVGGLTMTTATVGNENVAKISPAPATEPAGGLMRNFTSNRFNLKFWQKNPNNQQANNPTNCEQELQRANEIDIANNTIAV